MCIRDRDKPREPKEYWEVILNKVDEVCSRLNIERPILTIEPGRSIVGNAGITLYTIGAIKNIEGVRTYVSVDGGTVSYTHLDVYKRQNESYGAYEI